MRTIEFIKEVKSLGLEVKSCPVYLDVMNGKEIACTISNISMHDLQTGKAGFWSLEQKTRARLFELCVKYASTPNQER